MDAERDTFLALSAFDLSDFGPENAADGGNATSSTQAAPASIGMGAGAPIQFNGFDLERHALLQQLIRQQQPPDGLHTEDGLHQHQQQDSQQDIDGGIGDLNMFDGDGKDEHGRRAQHQNGQEQGQTQGQGDENPLMRLPSIAQMNGANADVLQQLLSMQMPLSFPMSASLPVGLLAGNGGARGSGGGGVGDAGSQGNPSAALLEQQVRIQQLQQLQLQTLLLQHQLELINGQNNLSNSLDSMPLPGSTAFRDPSRNQFRGGLPTPVNSSELRAQPNPNFVPPMALQDYMTQSHGVFSTPNPIPQGTSSAPAYLAFPPHTPLHSPGDIDFELSSPWFDNYQQPDQPAPTPTSASTSTAKRPQRRGSKRGASSSGDDSAVHARKRQSPAIRASTSGGGMKGTSSTRGSSSLSSTPALRARSRKNSVAGLSDVVGDTPSPVDLSMPPPAPPAHAGGSIPHESSQNLHQQRLPSANTTGTGPALSPVTPASIMNLGRYGLSSGLSSPSNAAGSATHDTAQGKRKSKSPPKLSVSGASSTTVAKSNKKLPTPTSATLISPSLKPLLPDGLPPSSAAHLAAASNYSHHLAGSASALNITPGAPLPPLAPAVRKTSHKAAEQKRRDSLKTSFDSLRLLLPPLPLPSDEGYAGEPPLPGSMPPRGPPRGDVTGPNRTVSKLQLLRCGNDFIRRLKERVTRRDEYIELLRAEVRALRAQVDVKAGKEVGGMEPPADVDELVAGVLRVDLELDLDAEEAFAPRLGGALLEGDEADEEGGD